MILDGIQAGYAAAHIILAAGTVPGCPVPPETNVRVYATTSATVINETIPMAQLQNFHVDTNDAYFANTTHARTGGIMQGVIGVEYGIELGWQKALTPGRACAYYNDISIILRLDPTIYIARDLARGGCLYDAVKAHEMEHVAIDRAAIESYAQSIERGFDLTFEIQGNRQSPPITPNERAVMQNRMEQAVITQTSEVLNNMYADRLARQQQLDTPQSYAALMRQCPDWPDEIAR